MILPQLRGLGSRLPSKLQRLLSTLQELALPWRDANNIKKIEHFNTLQFVMRISVGTVC